MTQENRIPGVYFVADGVSPQLVHQYTDEDYLLQDIAELLSLGELQRDGSLIVLQRELRPLKVRADAESFDHDEGFIEMCLDIWRFASGRDEEFLRFVSLE